MALVLHGGELAKLGLDMDSDVSALFAAMPGRMKKPPPDAENTFTKLAEAVEDDHQASTVHEMMELVSAHQFQKVLQEVGGKPTWIAFIEMIIGQKFKTGAPESAQLVPTFSARPSTFESKPIGRLLEADGNMESELLPEYIFDAVTECEDPVVQEISENDVTAVLNAYTHYMITEHRQPSGDKPLRARHAKLLKKRLPHLPAYGKTPGHLRKWYKILTDKKRNMSRKNALEVPRPPDPCVPAELPSYVSRTPHALPEHSLCGTHNRFGPCLLALTDRCPIVCTSERGPQGPHIHPGGVYELGPGAPQDWLQAAHRRAPHAAQHGAQAAPAGCAAAVPRCSRLRGNGAAAAIRH